MTKLALCLLICCVWGVGYAAELPLNQNGEYTLAKWGTSSESVKKLIPDLSFGYADKNTSVPRFGFSPYTVFNGDKAQVVFNFSGNLFSSMLIQFNDSEKDWMHTCSEQNVYITKKWPNIVYNGLRFNKFSAWAKMRWTVLSSIPQGDPVSVWETQTSYFRLFCEDGGVSLQIESKEFTPVKEIAGLKDGDPQQ